MNLILWRHAEAGDACADLEADLSRPLTKGGLRDAVLGANWLRSRLPPRTRIVVSPATRAIETAKTLTDTFEICAALGPDSDVETVLSAIDWPHSGGGLGRHGGLVLVGHQPWLGQLAALLLAGEQAAWSVKKGSIWWLARRMRGESEQTVLRAVLSPDFL